MSPLCLTSLTDRYSSSAFILNLLLLHPYSNVLFVAQVNHKFLGAGKALWTTLKFPDVWRPCLYMYLSIALSVDIHEGMFYWYTDSEGGPSFSQVYDSALMFSGSLTNLSCVILFKYLGTP